MHSLLGVQHFHRDARSVHLQPFNRSVNSSAGADKVWGKAVSSSEKQRVDSKQETVTILRNPVFGIQNKTRHGQSLAFTLILDATAS